jgi:hypothetical protein
MRSMVEPEDRFIGYVDLVGSASTSCVIAFSARTQRVAALMDGAKQDNDGNKEPTYSVVQEMQYRRVSLRSIDPSTIKTGSALSPEYLEKMSKTHGDWSYLKHGDLTMVLFQDTDGSMRNFGMFIFLSKERAERFVTAMKHAVTLCGGKESPFAPTATQ